MNEARRVIEQFCTATKLVSPCATSLNEDSPANKMNQPIGVLNLANEA